MRDARTEDADCVGERHGNGVVWSGLRRRGAGWLSRRRRDWRWRNPRQRWCGRHGVHRGLQHRPARAADRELPTRTPRQHRRSLCRLRSPHQPTSFGSASASRRCNVGTRPKAAPINMPNTTARATRTRASVTTSARREAGLKTSARAGARPTTSSRAAYRRCGMRVWRTVRRARPLHQHDQPVAHHGRVRLPRDGRRKRLVRTELSVAAGA